MNPKPIDNSEIVHTDGGTSITGKDAMSYFRAAQVKMGLSLHIKTGGKLKMTRGVGITTLLALTTEYTGNTYKRTEALRALAELETWMATMKAALPIIDERTKP